MSDSSDVNIEKPDPTQSTVGWVNWLAAILIIGLLIALLLPAIQKPSGNGRSRCKANLKNLGLALLNYEDTNGQFPPSSLADEPGRPIRSWRVQILPFAEYEATYEAYDLDQPWDSEHNLALAAQMPRLYGCPHDIETDEYHTSYVMVAGDGAITDGPSAVSVKDLREGDGLAYTILVAEMHNSGIHWMEPRDLDLAKMSLKISDPKRKTLRGHAGGAQAVFADGSVHFLSDKIDPRVLRALITVSGGETLGPDVLE